jgi:hypothetical protein
MVDEPYGEQKNRRVQEYRSISTAIPNPNISAPLEKDAWTRARFGTAYDLSRSCTNLQVHCCMRIAHSAQAILMVKLVSLGVFTRTANTGSGFEGRLE